MVQHRHSCYTDVCDIRETIYAWPVAPTCMACSNLMALYSPKTYCPRDPTRSKSDSSYT